MNCNKRRIGILLLLAVVLSFILTNCIGFNAETGFLGVLYTVVSVVFSVGMGMIYSLNPGRIANPDYYKAIKESITIVRDTSVVLFSLISLFFLISQVMRDANIVDEVSFSGLLFSSSSFAFSFSCMGLLYYVLNFGRLQDLNYEIEERMRS